MPRYYVLKKVPKNQESVSVVITNDNGSNKVNIPNIGTVYTPIYPNQSYVHGILHASVQNNTINVSVDKTTDVYFGVGFLHIDNVSSDNKFYVAILDSNDNLIIQSQGIINSQLMFLYLKPFNVPLNAKENYKFFIYCTKPTNYVASNNSIAIGV
ncbi:MAG: hypothetical protein QW478_01905 [Candidatus Micrarchaeaceae archaeon]